MIACQIRPAQKHIKRILKGSSKTTSSTVSNTQEDQEDSRLDVQRFSSPYHKLILWWHVWRVCKHIEDRAQVLELLKCEVRSFPKPCTSHRSKHKLCILCHVHETSNIDGGQWKVCWPSKYRFRHVFIALTNLTMQLWTWHRFYNVL